MCLGPTIRTHSKEELVLQNLFTYIYIPNTHIIYFQNIMLMLPSAFHSKCSSDCSNVYYSLRKCLSKLVQRIAIWSISLLSALSHICKHAHPVFCVCPNHSKEFRAASVFNPPSKELWISCWVRKNACKDMLHAPSHFLLCVILPAWLLDANFPPICYHCGDLRRRFWKSQNSCFSLFQNTRHIFWDEKPSWTLSV